MRNYRSHIKTGNSITVVFTEGDPAVIVKENPAYAQIVQLLKKGMYDEVAQVADIAVRVATRTKGRFKLDKETGLAVLKDEKLPQAIASKLVQLVDAKKDTKPLENFWARLKLNPSQDSRNDLYAFLEANKVPLTEDGYFIGYKRVDDDFKDTRTRTYDNTPGMTVEMDRSEVDPNRNNTCSTGLHVAAYKYAAVDYNGSTGKLLEIKVDPKDVVTVPPDYNQQKMRVCRYQVVGLATKEHASLVYSPTVPKLKGVKAASSGIFLDDRGRLQVNLQVLKAAKLRGDLAIRIDPRSPEKIRITKASDRITCGIRATPSRLGVYVPKDMFTKISDGTTFNYAVERGGLTLTKA